MSTSMLVLVEDEKDIFSKVSALKTGIIAWLDGILVEVVKALIAGIEAIYQFPSLQYLNQQKHWFLGEQ